jgi:transcription elongation factor Elf1
MRYDDAPIGFTCPECGSVHFNVRNGDFVIWLICCEGCGAAYELLPNGTAQLRMKGIDQS